MRNVYYADSAADAYLVRDMLRMQGVDADVSNELLSSVRGEIPMDLSTKLTVWIADESRAAEAEALIAERLRATEGLPWICGVCGNEVPASFEICWSCSAEVSQADRGPGPRDAALLRFLAEADRLKAVQRGSVLIDGSRLENAAEHSWHACLFALLLHRDLAEETDLLRTLTMLVVHDLVEIDAGDAYAYDPEANAGREERERAAADRLFALLPPDLARECRGLWEEFEAGETREARFARACDRLQPLSLNVASGGKGWKRGNIRREQVVARNMDVAEGDEGIVAFLEFLLERATQERMFADGD